MSYEAPPPPPYGSPYGGTPAAKSNKPVWALVCGVLGLLCCGLLGIPAIILGKQAQREGQPGGMAKAGEILGYVDLALLVLSVVLFVTGVFTFGRGN